MPVKRGTTAAATEQTEQTEATERPIANPMDRWGLGELYDPNDHLINLKGKEYLQVQQRLVWFIREQRQFMAMAARDGLQLVPFSIVTEEVEHTDTYARFKTTITDVFGNTATAYGSEKQSDFGDFSEKAATKSVGRALAQLGYGTQFAPEMDEGERVVDSPVKTNRTTQHVAQPQPAAAQDHVAPATGPAPKTGQNAWDAALKRAQGLGIQGKAWSDLRAECHGEIDAINAKLNGIEQQRREESETPATEQQWESLNKLCAALGKKSEDVVGGKASYGAMRAAITKLSAEYQAARRAS